METNQKMLVQIGDFTQEIEHKTMIGNLNTLWAYGNGLRVKKGLGTLNIDDYLRSNETMEFMIALDKKLKYGNLPYLKNEQLDEIKIEYDCYGRAKITEGKLSCIKTKKGKGGGTWAHLYILLDAAARLDANFKLEIYDAFITNKILQWRDDSGNEFKAINIAIDAYLPGRENKESNKGIYINLAKLLKDKINPNLNNWNEANYSELEKRTKYELQIIGFLRAGLIKDWEHLKEVIERI